MISRPQDKAVGFFHPNLFKENQEVFNMTFAKSDESQGLIDVSHVVEDGLITYKGLPAPVICDYLSR